MPCQILGIISFHSNRVNRGHNQEFPQKCLRDIGQGEGYSTTSISRHFMAVSLLKMHQIFMLAVARLRVKGEVAQVLVVSQPPTSHSEETPGRHFHFQIRPQLGNSFNG